MKALIKSDFEGWLVSQLTREVVGEDKLYYFIVGARKVYVFFEGQKIVVSDSYVVLTVSPNETKRIATGAKYHNGTYNIFIYGINALVPDKIVDELAEMLDEQRIEETGGFIIETGILATKQRGNKFAESNHYENITEIDFHHWSV